MTDNRRRVESFWILFGAVTIPYSGVLGDLLDGFSDRVSRRGGDIGGGEALYLTFCLIGLIIFFAAVPLVCLSVVRRWRPGRSEASWLGVAALIVCVWLLPTLEFGMPANLWRASTGAWLICCLTLAWLCRNMDIKKSIFK